MGLKLSIRFHIRFLKKLKQDELLEMGPQWYRGQENKSSSTDQTTIIKIINQIISGILGINWFWANEDYQ